MAQRREQPTDAGRFQLFLPIKLVNPLNGSHGHWSVATERKRRQRRELHLAFPARARGLVLRGVWPRCQVTLTRLSPGELDFDGLVASLKTCRDMVAFELCATDLDWANWRARFGRHDSDSRLAWLYQQERSSDYAVRIELERREAA